MWPFSLLRKKNYEALTLAQPAIVFVGEQDGPAERDLKASLRTMLAEYGTVERAYLCKVDYQDSSPQAIALCLVTPEDPNLVAAIAEAFRELFHREVFLDIIFVDVVMEQELAAECLPFFAAD